MKSVKIKEPVRIRLKELANGNKSVYLDIYNKGVRKYDFLQLYVIPEITAKDREANAATLALANAIKAKRIVEIQNSMHGFSSSRSQSKLRAVDFLQTEADRYISRGSKAYGDLVGTMTKHLIAYAGTRIILRDINRSFVEGFIKHLHKIRRKNGNSLCESTQNRYLSILCVVLERAVHDGIIDKNPVKDIPTEDKPSEKNREREFLTLNEVRKLADTPCANEAVKHAFLFSCFCGLRLSDITALTWKSIRDIGEGRAQIDIVQEKTKEEVHIPISENATKQLPLRGKNGDRVFNMPHRITMYKILTDWAKSAKIEKHVTFHTSRHTCATLLLTHDVDLYTVSKLLGHSNIKTTQIYGNIIDSKKRDAVDMIPNL